MITEWRQVQNSIYRRQDVADLGNWKADMLSRQYQLLKVAVNPRGGSIAAVFCKDGTTICLRIYSAFGTLVDELVWTYNCCVVVDGCWVSCKECVFVFQDGVVRIYDTTCFGKPYAYTISKKPLSLCGICPKGVLAVVSENHQVLWFDLMTKDTQIWKFSAGGQILTANGTVTTAVAAPGSLASTLKFVDVFQRSSDNIYGLVVNGEGCVYQIWSTGCRRIKFASSGAETTSSVIVSFAISYSGAFGAFRTDDGFLIIASLKGLALPAAASEAGNSVSLSVSVVSTPTLLADQLVWLGDHCVGMTSKTPTLNNPNQTCLFIGGPQSKWIDLHFTSPVILIGSKDLKYLCYSSVGVIQFAEPETLRTFSPGSCHSASMICFALDDLHQSAAGDAGLGASSSDWEEDDEVRDEMNRLDDSLRKRIGEQRMLDQQDLNFLFFRKKWQTRRRRRFRPKELDAISFISSMTATERAETLEILQTAVKWEYSINNIILCVKSIRLLLQFMKENGEEVTAKHIYYKLIRDIRSMKKLRIRLEILQTYEDFLELKLTGLIDLCQRDQDLCLQLCDTYNLGKETQTYINIQRSKLILYQLMKYLSSEGVGKPPSLTGMYDIEGIRAACWCCLKYGKKTLGYEILQKYDDDKLVLLYFYRLIDDMKSLVAFAKSRDDTDALDYLVYLQCQAIFNSFSPTSTPARYHLNQFANIIDDVAENSSGDGEYAQDPDLMKKYVIQTFLQYDARVTELPNASYEIIFNKIHNEIKKIYQDTGPQNNASAPAQPATSSFLSNLINPRSLMKDTKKTQIQKSLAEIRMLYPLLPVLKFSDPKAGLQQLEALCELTVTKKPTVKDVVLQAITKNQVNVFDTILTKFSVPPNIVKLWKLEALAANNHWNVFCHCAIEAARSVSLESRLSSLNSSCSANAGGTSAMASGSSFNIFSTFGNRGGSDADILRLLGQGNAGSSKSSAVAGFIGTVLQNASNARGAGDDNFTPLLPSALTGAGQEEEKDTYLPEKLPVASFKNIPIVDFVSIARTFKKYNLALCLLPYIVSSTLREKWAQSLGLKSADQFARNALICAGSRSSSKFAATNGSGDYQLFIQTVKKTLEQKS